jgi:acyl-coenzyme A synthetase/AMP-(fatty) acid ligase
VSGWFVDDFLLKIQKAVEMTTFIPLHNLMSTGRDNAHSVCHSGHEFVDWQAYSNRVASLAHGLKLRTEMRWLLTSSDTLDFSVQLLALLHAGKQVIIPPNTQVGTLVQLAGEFDAIVSNEFSLPSTNQLELSPLDLQAASIDLYTSGSTGNPKRVRKTLAQFEAEIEVLEALWGNVLGDCVVMATVPHHHIYGLIFRILWPLSAGRLFDAVTCTHPDILHERVVMFNQNILVSSPAQLSRLPGLVALSTVMKGTGLIFSSGGPLSIGTASEFHRDIGFDPIEIFGSTETGGIAWRRQCVDAAWEPLSGVTISRDDNGAMLLSSPFLADTSALSMDDAVELLSDGKFNLLGRLDRVVKIEEKRLSLPEMESLLTTHAWVKTAAATSLTGRRQRVGVVVELSADGIQQLANYGRRHVSQQLKYHLSERFESVLLPKQWRFLEQMPVNAQGKLTYATITALFTSEETTKESRHVTS